MLIKGKEADFRKSCKNFKNVDGHHLTHRGQRVIFDNDRKLLIPQYHSILPQPNTHLRPLNCKQSKPIKCFNIRDLISFCLQVSFRGNYFPKEYLFTRKK